MSMLKCVVGELVKYPSHKGKVYEYLGEFQVPLSYTDGERTVIKCRNVKTGEIREISNMKYFYLNVACLSMADMRVKDLEHQVVCSKQFRQNLVDLFAEAVPKY